MDVTKVDREVLAAVFASRVSLAKKTEDQAVADVRLEWAKARAWVFSKASENKQGTFLWMCDFFDLEPTAVRRTIPK